MQVDLINFLVLPISLDHIWNEQLRYTDVNGDANFKSRWNIFSFN